MRDNVAIIKHLVNLYYGQEDEYYINLALEEIERGLTIKNIQELMYFAEL